MEKTCIRCKKQMTIEIANDIELCCECIEYVSSKFGNFIDFLDREIREKYNISDLNDMQLPIGECFCNYRSVIPFDYYTAETEDGNICVVLCCLCRDCNNYRVVPLEDVLVPFNFRELPKHTGLNILKLEKTEEVTYIS